MTRNRLLIPGPVDVEDDVLAELGSQVSPHYGARFVAAYRETTSMSQQLLGTRGDVFLIPGPGTAGIEAVMGSLLHTGEVIAVPQNGHFGERLADVAARIGLKVIPLSLPVPEAVDPQAVARLLAAHPEVRTMAIVHNETSSGVLNPLEEIAAVAREAGVTLIVDAISSAGGVPLPMDEWAIDFVVTVPNKCLEAAPGFSIVAASSRGIGLIEQGEARLHSWYLDLRVWRDYATRWADWHPYPVTLPTNNILALRTSLRRILNGGLVAHQASLATAAQAVRSRLHELGFTSVVEGRAASPLVSAFWGREGLPIAEMLARLESEHHVMIAGAPGALSGKAFRVGHMGKARSEEYIEALCSGIGSLVRGSDYSDSSLQ